MNNSIPQVTSIAAAAQSILEANNSTTTVSVKSILAFDDRVVDIYAYLVDVKKTIAVLTTASERALTLYKRIEKEHGSIMNIADIENTDSQVEISKEELHMYIDDLNELVNVHVKSLNAAKGDLTKNIAALVGASEAATKMEKAILRVL